MAIQQLSERLNGIEESRHSRVPQVQKQLERLDNVEESLRLVSDAATGIPPDGQSNPVVGDALDRLRDPDERRAVGLGSTNDHGVRHVGLWPATPPPHTDPALIRRSINA